MLALLLFAAMDLEQASQVANAFQRDKAERAAFLAAAATDRDAALRHVSRFLDRPWLGEVSFGDAVALARRSAGGERLLVASAQRYPSAALRSYHEYRDLEYGPRVFGEAVRLAPDEAAMVASGGSTTAADLRADLAESPAADVKLLGTLAGLANVSGPVKGRAAVLHREIAAKRLSMQEALRLAEDAGAHFSRVVDVRLAGDSRLDRYLTVRARELCLQEPVADLRKWRARDLLVLLGYARPEDEETFFGTIFDGALKPQMQGRRWADLVREAGALEVRQFLSTALAEGRLEIVLEPAVIRAALSGIATLEQAVLAAEVVDALEGERLRVAAGVVKEQMKQGPFYGVLAAMIAARAPGLIDAGEYAKFWSPPQLFKLSCAGVCVQRHLFYNDRDGVESYESFRAALAGWDVEQRDGWMKASRQQGERRVVIFANIPLDGASGETERREKAVEAAMGGTRPTVLVHRGHAYHVENSLKQMSRENALVVLGSCRGLRDAMKVLEAAPR
ncbi:MAG: hypothetical protein JNN08_29615, partial [Bryobacterales bacterium]|nr:hypothetical protein [Bryobacterales bacterium]